VRQLLDGVGSNSSFLEASKTIGTGANVGLEGSNAETLLIIDEEVDLGREEVTMIHVWVYAQAWKWVSE
jgi:hypothetical protein